MDKVCYSKIISSLHTLEEVSQGEWVVFTQVLIYLVTSFSYLRYRNEIWGSLSDTKLDQLQHLQDRARTLIAKTHIQRTGGCVIGYRLLTLIVISNNNNETMIRL